MEDLRQKRRLIERGHLNRWSRRGRAPQAENIRLIPWVTMVGLRLTGLYSRAARNAVSPVLKRIRIAFDHLPESFDGFTILHLSDLHVDGDYDLATHVARELGDLEVDLCVLTGDYRFKTTGTCERVYPNMQRLLSSVRSRRGVVGILGNHDCSEMVPRLEEIGVRMLLNQAQELRHGEHSVWLLGLDDPHYYGCDDLPGALVDVPPDAFKILLVHSPEMIEEAAAHGIHLYLCGHTHGGQICLPFIGPLITRASCSRRFVRGAWWYKGVSGYTSPGVGCSGVPARFLCPPELVVIELCRTPEATSTTSMLSSPASTQNPSLSEDG